MDYASMKILFFVARRLQPKYAPRACIGRSGFLFRIVRSSYHRCHTRQLRGKYFIVLTIERGRELACSAQARKICAKILKGVETLGNHNTTNNPPHLINRQQQQLLQKQYCEAVLFSPVQQCFPENGKGLAAMPRHQRGREQNRIRAGVAC